VPIPVLKPTAAQNETYAGVTYHIEGELVPVLHLELSSTPVYFEHYILLWKDLRVQIGIKPIKGAFKRMLAGMPVFLTEVAGPGQIGFSRDGAGHILAIHLRAGEGIDMREHQFLAATSTVEYAFSRVKGVSNMLLGGTGFFIDHFHAQQSEGIVWVHGYGNVFEVTLAAGEQIDIEPGGWVYIKTRQSAWRHSCRGSLRVCLPAPATWCGTASPGRDAWDCSRCTCTCRRRSRIRKTSVAISAELRTFGRYGLCAAVPSFVDRGIPSHLIPD
jgi:uncharacterized protein (AIM24 family)